MATLDSTTTRKSRGSVFQSITRSPATSKTFGNLLLPLTSKRGRQRSHSGRGIFLSASKVDPASQRDTIVKAKRRRHIHCRLRAYAKQGASESRMLDYFESCCSCRRRTNCVEKTAASKPMIGKNVLASGIGLTPVAAVHSSNPPLP